MSFDSSRLADDPQAAIATSPGAGIFGQALFAHSPLSTVVYDPAGRITAANDAFERLFELRVADIQATYSILEDPQLAELGLAPSIRRAFEGEPVVLPPLRYDARRVAGAGSTTWTQGYFYPVRDAAGTVVAVVLVHVDLTERRRAEDAARLLAEAGAALAGSLDQQVTLATVARLAVPAVGDFCAVDLVDPGVPGGVRRAYTRHADPARESLLAGLRRYPPALDSAAVVAEVLRTGAPRFVPVVDVTAFAVASEGRSEHERILSELAPESVIVAPLVARDATIGALSLAMAGSGRRFTEADLTLVGELARRAALAMDNARLHAESLAARDRSEAQAVVLDGQAQRLREQAAELEAQRHELEEQIEEAHSLAEELQQTNEALQAATALAESEREAARGAARDVSAILESIGDPFVVHDAEWRFRYINAPAAALFAASGHGGAERLLGQPLWDAYPDLVGTATERVMRRAAAGRQPVTSEVFYPRTGAWSELRCYPMPDGGLATSWTDVSARKRAEEAQRFLGEATALLASSLDYEATLRSLARLVVPTIADWCSVHVLDGRGVPEQLAVAHVDPARVELAYEIQRRYPPNPNAPHGVPHVVRTGRPELIARITDEMVEAGAVDAEHLRLIRGLGLRSAMVLPLVARGRVLGALTLIAAESGRHYDEADLSLASELARRAALAVDNARLHRDALDARRAAEAANRAKADFLAVMSHELRTPLNAIGGYTQLIEMGVRGPVSEEQRADLERIQRSQRHLLGLINDVLNYAKLEAARVEFRSDDIPVAPLLGGLGDLVAPQLAAKRLDYECRDTAPALMLRGDEEKVRQILLNLLSNAVKFTAVAGRVSVSSAGDDGVVRILVADTGVGIPAGQLEVIFEPFVQLARGLSSGHEGTGLGLAISRDLARGMGGDLTAASEVGRGSTFTLTLPRA